ncbi:GNAT family N-acetyltransferase [Nocardia yunnanensis]|uniref:GNAT family N-acetyltransferase n=1 Tax=Nocardia yunnanensis TaxID=2382165 RepID=UPI0013C4D02C|nr:GNAT family N-acetyltransferase [Nocardia yunnanensis]
MLQTERLTLTPVNSRDHDALARLWRTPEVREFLFDGETLGDADVTRIIANSEKDFAAADFGFWTVRERETGILVGTAGLRRLDGGPELEVVYSLDPEHWGRGFAGEAAAAVVAYAFEKLGAARVLAEVDAGNAASIAVIERLGMRPFATVPGALGLMWHYALANPAHAADTA